MAIYSGFSHEKWWFSIAMLVHQRVVDILNTTLSYIPLTKAKLMMPTFVVTKEFPQRVNQNMAQAHPGGKKPSGQ